MYKASCLALLLLAHKSVGAPTALAPGGTCSCDIRAEFNEIKHAVTPPLCPCPGLVLLLAKLCMHLQQHSLPWAAQALANIPLVGSSSGSGVDGAPSQSMGAEHYGLGRISSTQIGRGGGVMRSGSSSGALNMRGSYMGSSTSGEAGSQGEAGAASMIQHTQVCVLPCNHPRLAYTPQVLCNCSCNVCVC